MKNLIKQTNFTALQAAMFIMVAWAPALWYENFWGYLAAAFVATIPLTLHHAQQEATRITKGAHWKQVIFRTLAIIALAIYIIRDFSMPVTLLSLAAVIALIFGIIFDPVRNVKAGKDWFYAGTEANYDKMPPLTMFIFEIIGLGFTILLFHHAIQSHL